MGEIAYGRCQGYCQEGTWWVVEGLVQCLLAVPLLRLILNNLKRCGKIQEQKVAKTGKGADEESFE
jgi:hypothetical protein